LAGASDGRAAKPPVDTTTAGLDAVFMRRALTDERKTLDPWKQGDLVDGVTLFWGAPGGQDPLTGMDHEPTENGRWPVAVWDGVRALPDTDDPDADQEHDVHHPRWGVIVSQTCDVMGVDPGARHPTVQVSPLRKLTGVENPGYIARVQRHDVVELHHVTQPPEAGDWAVDLRISFPISKAVLLPQTPKSAFATEDDKVRFGDRLAAKVRRPALHDEISNGLVNRIREAVKDAQAQALTWPDHVEQIRALVQQGPKLQPDKVQLVVVLVEKLPDADRQPLRDVITSEKKRLKKHGITLTAAMFRHLDDLKADIYRRSDPLYIPELGNGAYW
jgi:hypothetical protein